MFSWALAKKLIFKNLAMAFVLVIVVFTLKSINRVYKGVLLGKVLDNFPKTSDLVNFESLEVPEGKNQNIRGSDEQFNIAPGLPQINISNKEEDLVIQEETESFMEDGEGADLMANDLGVLPANLKVTEYNMSEFEESDKGGYKDRRWGHRKVYRIMFTSSDLKQEHEKIRPLLSTFGAVKVSRVDPGTEVPGGLYYNIYIADSRVKDFIKRISSMTNGHIFPSRSTGSHPKGLTKVFIWVKQI